jgi:hypothetical protein
MATTPDIATKLTMEMATYLSFRPDNRVAELFARLIVRPDLLLNQAYRVQLVKNALVYNRHCDQLNQRLSTLNGAG